MDTEQSLSSFSYRYGFKVKLETLTFNMINLSELHTNEITKCKTHV